MSHSKVSYIAVALCRDKAYRRLLQGNFRLRLFSISREDSPLGSHVQTSFHTQSLSRLPLPLQQQSVPSTDATFQSDPPRYFPSRVIRAHSLLQQKQTDSPSWFPNCLSSTYSNGNASAPHTLVSRQLHPSAAVGRISRQGPPLAQKQQRPQFTQSRD